MQMITRKIGLEGQASTMAFYLQVMFIVVSSSVGLIAGDCGFVGTGNASLEFLVRAWRWPALGDGGLFLLIGVINAFGAYFMSQAYRSTGLDGRPFEYVALPLGMLWGWLIWRDYPDSFAILGIALIIGSGVYVIYREEVVRRQQRRGNTERMERPS